MTLTVTKCIRVFEYNGMELADINPNLSPSKIAELYAAAYPELLNVSMEGPEIVGEKMKYKFTKAAGGKG